MKIHFKLIIFACFISMPSRILCMANPRIDEVDKRMELVKNLAASLGVGAGSASYGAARMAMGKTDASCIITLPALAYALAHGNKYLVDRRQMNARTKREYDAIFNLSFWTGFEIGILGSFTVNDYAALQSSEDKLLMYTLLGSGVAAGLCTHYYMGRNRGEDREIPFHEIPVVPQVAQRYALIQAASAAAA